MGFFRTSFVIILAILLFFSLLAANTFFILGSSLNYDNVREEINSIVQSKENVLPEKLVGEFNLTKAAEGALNGAEIYCRNLNNKYYVSHYQGYSVNISCATVNIEIDPREIFNKTYEDFIYDIYYKEYDCDFWNCFSRTGLPFFLVSEKARDYWMEKFYFALLASLILMALIALFVEQKVNALLIVGILLAFSAFPLLKLADILYVLAGDFSALINLFLGSTRVVFLFSLALGILLFGMGLAMRLWMPDSMKKKFSVKDVKEIVKGEVAKEREKQTKKKKK